MKLPPCVFFQIVIYYVVFKGSKVQALKQVKVKQKGKVKKMNYNTIKNGNGKVFTRVVFLMSQNLETDAWEPMAYFPDIDWDMNGNKASYMTNGQHGPCCEAFAILDCIAPRPRDLKSVARLHDELKGMGYVLTVLDSHEWVKSHGKKKEVMMRNIYDAHYVGDSEEIMNKGNGKGKGARRAA